MLPVCQLLIVFHHLPCEQAEEALMPLIEHGLQVELVDVAAHPELAERAPVLRRTDTSAELEWPFDTDALVHFLK